MPKYHVVGRVWTYWRPIEPENDVEVTRIDVVVSADSPEKAREVALDKLMDNAPPRSESDFDFMDADTTKLQVREVTAAELAEMRLRAEQRKLREDVEKHAVGTLFDMVTA